MDASLENLNVSDVFKAVARTLSDDPLLKDEDELITGMAAGDFYRNEFMDYPKPVQDLIAHFITNHSESLSNETWSILKAAVDKKLQQDPCDPVTTAPVFKSMENFCI